jgi:hypothetical protein
MDYPGIEGFLGTRGSLMLDLVFLAMFAVLPVLCASIYMVKYHQMYALHKQIQLTLGVVLLAAVTLFEIDIRVNGWTERAEPSPYYAAIEDAPRPLSILYLDILGRSEVPGWVFTSLGIHLFFAVTTTLLWIVVIVRALRNFPSPPVPGPHSRWHLRWAKVAALDMGLTAVTGWIFYWLAFVA